jgi:hypothetical protein
VKIWLRLKSGEKNFMAIAAFEKQLDAKSGKYNQ